MDDNQPSTPAVVQEKAVQHRLKVIPLPQRTLSGPPKLDSLKVIQPQISYSTYMCKDCFKYCRNMPMANQNGRLIVQFVLCDTCVTVNKKMREVYAQSLFKWLCNCLRANFAVFIE